MAYNYLNESGLKYFLNEIWKKITNRIDEADGVPTNGIIKFDGTAEQIPEGYEVVNENGWHYLYNNVQISTYVKGIVKYIKVENIVTVIFDDIHILSEIPQHNEIIITGLPKPIEEQNFIFIPNDSAACRNLRMSIHTDGNIYSHYSFPAVIGNEYYATLIYITNE